MVEMERPALEENPLFEIDRSSLVLGNPEMEGQ
jgi:hypothetical protein